MCTNALVGLNDRNNVKLNQIHVLLKWHKDNYYKNVCFDSACTSYKLKLCVKSVLNCEINKSTHIKIVKIRPTQIFTISCVADGQPRIGQRWKASRKRWPELGCELTNTSPRAPCAAAAVGPPEGHLLASDMYEPWFRDVVWHVPTLTPGPRFSPSADPLQALEQTLWPEKARWRTLALLRLDEAGSSE